MKDIYTPHLYEKRGWNSKGLVCRSHFSSLVDIVIEHVLKQSSESHGDVLQDFVKKHSCWRFLKITTMDTRIRDQLDQVSIDFSNGLDSSELN